MQVTDPSALGGEIVQLVGPRTMVSNVPSGGVVWSWAIVRVALVNATSVMTSVHFLLGQEKSAELGGIGDVGAPVVGLMS